MNHTLRHLLIAAALIFPQQAAQLHALSHVQHDMPRAEQSGKCVPPVNHPAELCIAYHAVDSVLAALAPAIDPPQVSLPTIASAALPLPLAARIVFDSRAPPILS